MSSKTKIVVLHLKELIYTGIFALLGILFIILLIIMFIPKDKKETNAMETPAATYVPGIYTTSLILNDNVVDVEVTVDETNINDIRMINLDEAVAKYTSMVLLNAIKASLEKAKAPAPSPSMSPSATPGAS